MPVILVVEDEELLREIIHDALKEGGFDLTTVASGQEAVAEIESGVVKYSALVTDINLKGPMKGWEVARLVRQIDAAFPIVYMTAAAADEWASEGVPNSILLNKPFAQPNWLIVGAARRNRNSSFVLDGEAVLLGVDGVSDFNGLHSRKHDDEVEFYAFDCLVADGTDVRQLPQSMRKTNLARLLARRIDGIHAAPFEVGEIGRTCSGMPG